MTVLKIIACIVGVLSTVFGYLIYFRGKYNLINGFENDYKEGRKDENYAKRIGIVEFVVGICILLASIALILF